MPKSTFPIEDFLSVKEAAVHLDVSMVTVYNWIKRQAIECHRIGSRIRIPRQSVVDIAETLQTSPHKQLRTPKHSAKRKSSVVFAFGDQAAGWSFRFLSELCERLQLAPKRINDTEGPTELAPAAVVLTLDALKTPANRAAMKGPVPVFVLMERASSSGFLPPPGEPITLIPRDHAIASIPWCSTMVVAESQRC